MVREGTVLGWLVGNQGECLSPRKFTWGPAVGCGHQCVGLKGLGCGPGSSECDSGKCDWFLPTLKPSRIPWTTPTLSFKSPLLHGSWFSGQLYGTVPSSGTLCSRSNPSGAFLQRPSLLQSPEILLCARHCQLLLGTCSNVRARTMPVLCTSAPQPIFHRSLFLMNEWGNKQTRWSVWTLMKPVWGLFCVTPEHSHELLVCVFLIKLQLCIVLSTRILESACQGPVPGSATHQLCDLGHVT